jgi:VTC domain-containing protein
MATDINVLQRYELKYTISESVADAIREYIQPIFSLDSHACPEQRGYIVNNVYMDTPGLRFYYDTKFHKLTRFKPRVRYYGPRLDQFVILEIKHRHNTTTWKRRQRIDAHEWPGVMEVTRSTRVSSSHTAMPDTFAEVNHLYGTLPVLHVRYFREPYVSDIDDYGRITFDRALRYRLAHGSYDMESSDEQMIYYDDPVTAQWHESPVVLEIKTSTFVPFWVADLVRRFSLVQRGYSKYRYVIDRCLESGYDPSS